ncbi:MAG: DUF202 domain-containing protein [Leptolyngbyaceae cyanobacterium bins.349]|nr:DUF202 domain-containing protein [Leptolyngbyaceae cyanobacterium bins.349]
MDRTARPTNDVTELAKERNRQASERTVTSWIGHSLWLIGFGIVAEEVPAAWQQSLPRRNEVLHPQLYPLLSLGTIAVGIAILIPIAIAHYQELRSLTQEHYLTESVRFLAPLIGAVLLFGCVAIVYVVLVLSQ